MQSVSLDLKNIIGELASDTAKLFSWKIISVWILSLKWHEDLYSDIK